MAAMVSMIVRLLVVAALVGGCARAVNGTGHAVEPAATRPATPVPIADLLIEPSRFPARYPAVVVDPSIVSRLLRQIDAVADGSVVTPPECAPPPVAAAEGAAAQGVDQQTGASLIVTVTRPVPSLRARVDQLAGCASFTIATGGDAGQIADVAVNLPPAPVVDADDSYAVDQTVTPKSEGASGTQTLTFVARVADVRVTASWQGLVETSDSTPDTSALDTLFTAAVLKVRQLIPR